MARSRHLLMISPDYLAMEAARRLDVDVTLVIGGAVRDWGMPVPADVRVLVVDDHRSVDSTMGALYRAGLDGSSFDAVYTHDDRCLMNAAAIARFFDIRGLSTSVASLFRDKYLQKQRPYPARRTGRRAPHHRRHPGDPR